MCIFLERFIGVVNRQAHARRVKEVSPEDLRGFTGELGNVISLSVPPSPETD